MEKEEILVEETENTEEPTVEEEVQENTEEVEVEETPTEDQPVEEKKQPKTFTQDEVNEIVSKRQARVENRIRKEYEQKYGQLERVVNAGLGTENVEEATTKLTDFYSKKGVQIPTEPKYSDKDIEILAKAEADEIISSGYEDVKEETDRLASIGLDKMTKADKILYKRLADERKKMEDKRDLASIGVSESVLNDQDFIAYNEKLNPSLSLKERYEMYLKQKPKKELKKMGSMKNGASNNNDIKEFYTRDEALKFTVEDLRKNPKLEEAIEKSMQKW